MRGRIPIRETCAGLSGWLETTPPAPHAIFDLPDPLNLPTKGKFYVSQRHDRSLG